MFIKHCTLPYLHLLKTMFKNWCYIFYIEPPSPPVDVQVRADSSKSITVLWNEPEVTNGGINNYFVVCTNTKSGEQIINKTVFTITPVTEFFLQPNCTYSCSVIAYNNYGPSVAQQAAGTTLPVTSKPFK